MDRASCSARSQLEIPPSDLSPLQIYLDNYTSFFAKSLSTNTLIFSLPINFHAIMVLKYIGLLDRERYGEFN